QRSPHSSRPHTLSHSFPTRRSSDLTVHDHVEPLAPWIVVRQHGIRTACPHEPGFVRCPDRTDNTSRAQCACDLYCQMTGSAGGRDRKSTRLNSSHVKISYAVYCLKK